MSSPQQRSYTTSMADPPSELGDQSGVLGVSQILLCVLPVDREQQSVVPQEHPSQFFSGLAAPKAKLDLLRPWSPPPDYVFVVPFMTPAGSAPRHENFFSTGRRPPPGWQMRSVGCSTSEAASSSRPRRIVFSSTP